MSSSDLMLPPSQPHHQPQPQPSSPPTPPPYVPPQQPPPTPSLESISKTPYTTFTARQKRFLTFMLGLSMLASPFTATVYLPIIPALTRHFSTTTQAINLTVTVYLVFQAISPAIFATLSDSQGRRPIFLITYSIYVLASLGLALNTTSYAALLILRAIQSLGASAIISVAYGIIADVCVPSERGKMLGPIMVATNLGICVGPIIGGWLTLIEGGFQWVFRFLLIFGSVTLWIIVWAFPETSRNVVGNGSVVATGWKRTWWSFLRSWISRLKQKDEPPRSPSSSPKPPFRIPNPLRPLLLTFHISTLLPLWMTASFYAIFYCIQTSIPTVFQGRYEFNSLQVGLSYLPGGLGVVLAGPCNGKLMDWNYRRTARDINFTIDVIAGDDLADFPIERARSRGSGYLLAVFVVALVGYGWAIKKHSHPAVPLVLQGVIGFVFTCFNQTYSTLLVDIFPESPSTASAAGALARCALSAAAVAAMQPLIDVLDFGWYFSLLAALGGGGGVVVAWLLQTKAIQWRRKEPSDQGGGESSSERNRNGESAGEEVAMEDVAVAVAANDREKEVGGKEVEVQNKTDV